MTNWQLAVLVTGYKFATVVVPVLDEHAPPNSEKTYLVAYRASGRISVFARLLRVGNKEAQRVTVIMSFTNDSERQKRLSGLALAILATGNIITHSPAFSGLTPVTDSGHHQPGTHDTGKDSGGKDHGKHAPQHETVERHFRTGWRSRRHRRELKLRP